MTTERQQRANGQNARFSTGPRTEDGKAVSRWNARKHGLRSVQPVVNGLETVEDWEAHHGGIMEALAPVGQLEGFLAERVAFNSWRLQRVVRYETTVTALALETAEEDAAQSLLFDNTYLSATAATRQKDKQAEEMRERRETNELVLELLESLPGSDDNERVYAAQVWFILEEISDHLPMGTAYIDFQERPFLDKLGAPPDEDFEHFEWTAGKVREAIGLLAKHGKTSPEKLLRWATEFRRERAAEEEAMEQDEPMEPEKEPTPVDRQKEAADRLRRRRSLPDDAILQKIARYEGHISREMFKALHELQRLQALRGGANVAAPVAVDVSVDARQAVG
jgi:hypothetical protein